MFLPPVTDEKVFSVLCIFPKSWSFIAAKSGSRSCSRSDVNLNKGKAFQHPRDGLSLDNIFDLPVKNYTCFFQLHLGI